MADLASYFASRGWVAFSINYRLAGDFGTLPSTFPVVDIGNDDQVYAIYPACRDAKAAVRWIRANGDDYNLDLERITASGGSAGAITAVALGVVDESDCKDDISLDDDPTLASTNLDESSQVHTVVDFWGGAAMVNVVELVNGGESRFDADDAPMAIIHGTEDPTVTIDQAEFLATTYDDLGVPYVYYPLEGAGHGAWNATYEGVPIFDLAFDFVVERQELEVG